MRRLLVPVTTMVVLLAGCGFFRRTQNHFYSLSTIAPAAAAAVIGGIPLGVEAVELPPGIDRREIVVRDARHELEIRGTHQWSGPLEDMVIHTLAFNLANRLPEGMVILPGQAKPPGAMRHVYVIFEDLAPGSDQQFILDARWTLRESVPGMPELVRRERIAVPLRSMESAEVAAGMSQALATLSDRIVGALGGS